MQIGLVSPTDGSSWLGGLYIVQNLVLATTFIPEPERPRFRDVYWNTRPSSDPWSDIRPHLADPAVISLPSSLLGRARRALRRPASMADLFRDAGVDAMFPVRLLENSGVPFVFHLPDFQHRYLPEINDQRVRDYFDESFGREARAAARVHVSSQAVMRDVEQFLPEILPKVRVVFPVSIPTPLWYHRDPRATAQQRGLPERYFVIPNMVAAHKNHRTIARALSILRSRGVDAHVVCTGKTADYRDPSFFPRLTTEIRELGVEDRLHFAGVLERGEQMAVIRRAIAVIQPSLFEGWGAAVAEAKALGKPLLASDLPVNREHAPEDVRWIEALDAEAWAEAMAEVLSSRAPGPDVEAEERARARIEREAVGVGRAFTALFAEIA